MSAFELLTILDGRNPTYPVEPAWFLDGVYEVSVKYHWRLTVTGREMSVRLSKTNNLLYPVRPDRKEDSWAKTAYLYLYDMDGAAESTAKC